MDSREILNNKVSFQKTAYADLTHELPIRDVLRGIKEERLKGIVTQLRGYLDKGDKGIYDKEKKKLPGVTFGATFNGKRRRNDIKEYNRIIVLDIDKLDSEELTKINQILLKDNFVLSFWKSPSNNGIKGLVVLDFEEEIYDVDLFHRIAFKKLVEYFYVLYKIELDESGSDTTRLCFLSSDSKIVIKDNFEVFAINSEDIAKYSPTIIKRTASKGKSLRKVNRKDALLNASGKNSPQNRLTISSIIKFLTKRELSITNTYDKWYRVAFAIANSFTHDIGENYFLKICRLDKDKHNEIECKNLLINCYETTNSEINFSTIFHFAQELGYKPKKVIDDGSEGV
ncbi:MAG: PriCT-2 domain-containing protein [Carboxylicivirga sp.]|jgi:hypothetical protein|nr:PriCT-2 domain-containing protein [Carboxylicivirga sp.]MCT4647627.1 PriCT-2 domain-containing protein [Carboxylicivirga sp.]